jgi:hypothetical protein
MDKNFPGARTVRKIGRQGAMFTTIKRAARLDSPSTTAVAAVETSLHAP